MPDADDECEEQTCHSLGVLCGMANDGCGETLDCGPCEDDCEREACGERCGTQSDGCGDTIDCGPCEDDECEPGTCDAEGACGMVPAGCGELLDCGPCEDDCEPTTCEADDACGSVPNGCGEMLDCRPCECDGPEGEEQRFAQRATSQGFPAPYESYAEIYDLYCASADDCVVGCEVRGGTEAMCAASECIMSTTDYCLPATVWTNLEAVRSEGTATSDGAGLVLVYNGFEDYLLLDDFKFEVPDDAEIQGITVTIRRAGGSDAVAVDGAIRLIKGGLVGSADRSSPTPWTGPEYVNVEYGGSEDLWGETWTAAEINSPDFGVAISTLYTGTAGNGRAYVDIVYATVHYRECE